MKLSKRLLASGVLGCGRVRHCSEWEFDSLRGKSRFGASAFLREAEKRRVRSKSKRRFLFSFPAAVMERIRKK